MIVIPGLLLWLLFVAAETEHSGSWETEDLADHLEVLGETHKTASVEAAVADLIACVTKSGGYLTTACMETYSNELPEQHRDTMINCTVKAFEKCGETPETTRVYEGCVNGVKNCMLLL